MTKSLRDTISIKGARANNLQNVDLELPKNQLIVVTGVSGSGKSSITIDTLYAEGQRRYVESLSSYARQFLNRMKKPEVDFIKGICPAIAIEQKVTTSNARSTVGSLTEIYDYLRLLYARIGKTYSPVSGELVKKHEVSDVVEYIHALPPESRVILLIPLHQQYVERTIKQELTLLLQKGYSRVEYENEQHFIEDMLQSKDKILQKRIADVEKTKIRVVIDRFVVEPENTENRKRIADSVSTAFSESGGECYVQNSGGDEAFFNNKFELDGITFIEPNQHLFNYNNPFGACPRCEGFGRVMGIDEDKVIPDPTLSVYEGAIHCWKGEKSGKYLEKLLQTAHHFDFPIHRSYEDLNEEQKDLLWDGNEYFKGIHDFFDHLEKKSYKIQNRVMIARYRGRTVCNECRGSRLREEASYVKVAGHSINQLINLPIDQLLSFFEDIKLSDHDQIVAKRLLIEIVSRLKNLCALGLDYLHLDRVSSTLSGGETQRINLTKSIGSNLTNSMYILDEPSIGLHARDTEKLVQVLKELRDLHNTVIVVEHEEDVIRSADYQVDMGPEAGIHGGKVVFAGPFSKLNTAKKGSLTADYLQYKKFIPIPERRRKGSNKVHFSGIRMHNLQNVDVEIPLNTMTVVSGVSGSGKSTLVHDIIFESLKSYLDDPSRKIKGNFKSVTGDLSAITQLELINQQPIGKSSRSNPVTYVKAYDAIRKLMTNQQLSKIRGYQPKHFSFNVEGGRCDTCQGEGEIVVEMQFLADVRLQCEDCKGHRFKKEILEVKYNGKNISDILQLSIEEAIEFFAGQNEVVYKLKPLEDVGLGYVKLGQSSSTLSGGEAQRVKLASFLGRERSNEHILFIFDEPTTGLHFHDVRRLLEALNALVEQGHTVLIVEHNLDVIKSADWVIDLGPGGGRHGGKVLFQGTPEALVENQDSYTARYIAEKMEAVLAVQEKT
ncbi:MAG: excinuclease ABC subunit UvrA [Saprospiraceae bacterium]|nr:excinuclease ABC subunit UvrA [Saprospiraceae bacterium]